MSLRECAEYIRHGLRGEIAKRHSSPGLSWIINERQCVTTCANEWAAMHGLSPITIDEVEKVENLAVGHIDYVQKFSLYVAELLYDEKRVAL